MLVGNAAYPGAQLRNPVNDVELLADTLRKLDFDVETLTDAGKTALEHAIVSFGLRLAEVHGHAISLFYFSGHGIQHQGQNYLIPVDAHIPEARYLRSGAIRVDFLLEELARTPARANVIVLDACRNNPIPVIHQGPEVLRGLAAIEAVPNATAIVFSTAAGSVAADGDGDHSPYALALSRALGRRGAKLHDILFGAAAAVTEETRGAQRPALFVQGSIPDVELAPLRDATAGAANRGPWGRLQELSEPASDAAAPGDPAGASELPDPVLTIERPLRFGELRYGLSQSDWEQGMPGNLVNEVIDTGRWPQVEAGFERREPYAATLVAIRNMAMLRADWGTPDTLLAGRAALIGAKAGIRQAFMVLAHFYSIGGGGFPRDVKVHRAIEEALAERGYGLAQLQFASDLALGFSGPPAPGEAIGWLERAAANGATNAFFEMGRLYTDRAKHCYQVDYEKARYYLERSVCAGDARGATLLAELHLDGKLPPADPNVVTALLEMGVASGNATAMFRRALRLEHGDGIPSDLPRAMKEYEAAAEAGSTAAFLALSHHYTHGNACTPVDPDKAFACAEAALSRGDSAAYAVLGTFYEHGFGVEPSSVKAAELFRSAAISHDPAGSVGQARLGLRCAFRRRDVAEIERHLAAARSSNDQAARDRADDLLQQLRLSERLERASTVVILRDIACGASAAPVTLDLFISIADADCARFAQDVLPLLKQRFIEPGHAQLIVREGSSVDSAGVWAIVRSAEAAAQLAIIERLLETQERWVAEKDQVAAIGGALAEFGYEASRVARALASSELVSRTQYAGGVVASGLGVSSVPTIFVNGMKLVRPDFDRLERAVLQALPPETAVRLHGRSTLRLFSI